MNFLSEILDVLTMPQMKVGLLAVAASIGTAFGMPAAYQDKVSTIITAICTLAGLIITGISYERGKAVEGTVPPGSKSVYDVPAATTDTKVPLRSVEDVKNYVASLHQTKGASK